MIRVDGYCDIGDILIFVFYHPTKVLSPPTGRNFVYFTKIFDNFEDY